VNEHGLGVLVKAHFGREYGQHPELSHPSDCGKRVFLHEDMLHFMEQTVPSQLLDKSEPYGIADQVSRLLLYAKSEPLFKTNSPQDPRGIFHKAQAMEHPDHFILQIAMSSEKIDQLAKFIRIKSYRQGIDREVSPVEIHFEGAELDDRQRRGVWVVLEARRSHIDPSIIGKNKDGCIELLMGPGSDSMFLCIDSGKLDSVPFYDQIDVGLGMPQHQVPDEASHRVDLAMETFRQFPEFSEHLNDVPGELLCYDGRDVLSFSPLEAA
jgi:hypothetical protein